MDLKREFIAYKTLEKRALPPTARKQLKLLRDTEALLRCKTVKTLVTVLPPPLATNLSEL
jgi:hypothetical protein